MKAKDVMTAPVLSVGPETSIAEIVALLLGRRISGVLVVDAGAIVGVVGVNELLHRHEIGTDDGFARRGWWQRLIATHPASAAYVRTHGGRAADVMERRFTTVQEDAAVSAIAVLFEARHVRRVPVLRGNELVGIVTRADLVKALAAHACGGAAAARGHISDESIREQLLGELGRQSWWQPRSSAVFVHKGIVQFIGLYDGEADRQAARVAAENVAGVRGVEDDRMRAVEWQPMV